MYLLGGWRPCAEGDQSFVGTRWTVDAEVWRSQDGQAWECINHEAPWPGRHTAGYVVHDDKMWVVGGDIYCNTDDVWSSHDGVEWECTCAAAPWGPGRLLHHTVAFNGYIFVIGGQRMPQFRKNTPNEGKYVTAPPLDEKHYADVWRSADGKSWKCVCTDAPWGPRRSMIGGSAVKDGFIWLLGGGSYETPERQARDFRNDVWRSSDGENWECVLEQAPWPARQYHDISVWDGKLWVCEGYGGGDGKSFTASMADKATKGFEDKKSFTAEEANWPSLDDLTAAGQPIANRKDVWYSSDGVSWTELVDSPFLPRHAASLCAFDDALWLMAGNAVAPDGSWTVSDVWSLRRRAGKL
eukprot:COSAG05_NODE_3_length_51333_cov_129.132080_1_plen_354_part_00